MSQTKDSLSANQAWAALLEKYPIREEIGQKGYFRIKASQIKEFREPRLMAKWDSSDALPEVLQKNRINLLPDSRSSYVLGNFLLYQPIPELEEPVTRMSRIRLPEFETIDAENIGSEANAIHVLVLSGVRSTAALKMRTAWSFWRPKTWCMEISTSGSCTTPTGCGARG